MGRMVRADPQCLYKGDLYLYHDIHRSGILQIFGTRNPTRMAPAKEVECNSVSLAPMTPILVLLAKAAWIAMLLIKRDITVLGKT